jgi:opacity protein-like surface antigen
MKTSVCVLAVLAAAVSTSAVAKDLKQNKQAPAVSATQMTESEMDRVTGGLFFINGNGVIVDNPGQGHANGIGRGNGAQRCC